MKKTFVSGALLITIATFASKFFGSIFRVPLQNIAGDEVLGIFSLVYPLYMVALFLSVAGIPMAISKLIAEARVAGDQGTIRDIFVTAGILTCYFGITSFLLISIFSKQISYLFGGPSTQPAILIVSFTLLIAPYMATYRGFYQGFDIMHPTAVSQVLEQLIRVVLIVVIAYYLIEKGAADSIVAGGTMVGSFVGALVSLLYLRTIFLKSPLRPKADKKYECKKFFRLAKKILKYSVPFAIGSMTVALFNLIDSFTIPFALKEYGEDDIHYLYGIYGRGLSITQITTVVSTSLVLPLIPMISSALTKGNRGQMDKTIGKARRMNHFISWSVALGAFSLALPTNVALFGDVSGSLVLAMLGLSSLLISQTVLGTGILLSINLQNTAFYIVIFGVFLKMLLNFFFVKQFGLVGAATSSLIVYGTMVAANTFTLKKYRTFKVIQKSVSTYIFASCMMAAVVGIPTLFLEIDAWTRVFASAYLIVAIFVGAILYVTIVVLKNGVGELTKLPVIGGIFNRLNR